MANHDSPDSASGSPSSAQLGSPRSPAPAEETAASAASPSRKRASSTTDANAASKVTKRRAARACVSCRARKVRCDVVEGAPCGNCRWDNVECIVQASRRRKKNIFATAATTLAGQTAASAGAPQSAEVQHPNSTANNRLITTSTSSIASSNLAGAVASETGTETGTVGARGAIDVSGTAAAGLEEGHVPHLIYQRSAYRTDPVPILSKLGDAPTGGSLWADAAGLSQTSLLGDLRAAHFLSSLEDRQLSNPGLPLFIKPLPAKILPEDVRYLHMKGALTLPSTRLQNALLKAYVEYVHPYMPLLELHEFLDIIHTGSGEAGRVSLFLYHAVMFSATAFVESKYLREAGYSSRRAARKAYFQKARLLYDFDYEADRLVLVQALLLMTYWYETPDDQKDTWHWMGVAISLAHTIGLHRNPANATILPRKQKLWKRIWWSCFMRDRLIALGMRRPTRIKDEDFDVPMLEEADFEVEVLPETNTVLGPDCAMIRDLEMQRQLAVICIEKAKLCVCISHMLKAQYSVLNRQHMRRDDTESSTMMLLPNKDPDNVDGLHTVDLELAQWHRSLPESCQYRTVSVSDTQNGQATMAVQRSLLHMVYLTTVSALHRPQFLPSSTIPAPTVSRQVQELSRLRVCDAATQVTRLATELHHFRLDKFLPTTGVTVILPAMIIHLLEMKSHSVHARENATRGFRQCMRVMEKLREIYAAADFAVGFLDAALRKAGIDEEATNAAAAAQRAAGKSLNDMLAPPLNLALPTSQASPQHARADELSTPPPENASLTEADLYRHLQRDDLGHAASSRGATMRGASPPQTEREELDDGTPSATGSSSADDMGGPMDLDLDSLAFGGFAGAENQQSSDAIDWNTVVASNLDFDQWLQYPAEGVTNSDETFMGILNGGGAGVEQSKGSDQAMDWITFETAQVLGKGDENNNEGTKAAAVMAASS